MTKGVIAPGALSPVAPVAPVAPVPPAPPAPRRYERCPLTYLRDMYREAAKAAATPPKQRAAAAAYVPIRVVYGFDLKK